MTFFVYLLGGILTIVGVADESLFSAGLTISIVAMLVSGFIEIFGTLPKRTTNAKKLF